MRSEQRRLGENSGAVMNLAEFSGVLRTAMSTATRQGNEIQGSQGNDPATIVTEHGKPFLTRAKIWHDGGEFPEYVK